MIRDMLGDIVHLERIFYLSFLGITVASVVQLYMYYLS
jgi:hypothetical protein